MKKKAQVETAKEKETRIRKLRSRTYKWDKTDMNYCLENGISIYPACQPNGKLILFVQQGERFKPLDNKIYGQTNEEECLEYTVAIIYAYTEYADKIRLKKKR